MSVQLLDQSRPSLRSLPRVLTLVGAVSRVVADAHGHLCTVSGADASILAIADAHQPLLTPSSADVAAVREALAQAATHAVALGAGQHFGISAGMPASGAPLLGAAAAQVSVITAALPVFRCAAPVRLAAFVNRRMPVSAQTAGVVSGASSALSSAAAAAGAAGGGSNAASMSLVSSSVSSATTGPAPAPAAVGGSDAGGVPSATSLLVSQLWLVLANRVRVVLQSRANSGVWELASATLLGAVDANRTLVDAALSGDGEFVLTVECEAGGGQKHAVYRYSTIERQPGVLLGVFDHAVQLVASPDTHNAVVLAERCVLQWTGGTTLAVAIEHRAYSATCLPAGDLFVLCEPGTFYVVRAGSGYGDAGLGSGSGAAGRGGASAGALSTAGGARPGVVPPSVHELGCVRQGVDAASLRITYAGGLLITANVSSPAIWVSTVRNVVPLVRIPLTVLPRKALVRSLWSSADRLACGVLTVDGTVLEVKLPSLEQVMHIVQRAEGLEFARLLLADLGFPYESAGQLLDMPVDVFRDHARLAAGEMQPGTRRPKSLVQLALEATPQLPLMGSYLLGPRAALADVEAVCNAQIDVPLRSNVDGEMRGLADALRVSVDRERALFSEQSQHAPQRRSDANDAPPPPHASDLFSFEESALHAELHEWPLERVLAVLATLPAGASPLHVLDAVGGHSRVPLVLGLRRLDAVLPVKAAELMTAVAESEHQRALFEPLAALALQQLVPLSWVPHGSQLPAHLQQLVSGAGPDVRGALAGAGAAAGSTQSLAALRGAGRMLAPAWAAGVTSELRDALLVPRLRVRAVCHALRGQLVDGVLLALRHMSDVSAPPLSVASFGSVGVNRGWRPASLASSGSGGLSVHPEDADTDDIGGASSTASPAGSRRSRSRGHSRQQSAGEPSLGDALASIVASSAPGSLVAGSAGGSSARRGALEFARPSDEDDDADRSQSSGGSVGPAIVPASGPAAPAALLDTRTHAEALFDEALAVFGLFVPGDASPLQQSAAYHELLRRAASNRRGRLHEVAALLPEGAPLHATLQAVTQALAGDPAPPEGLVRLASELLVRAR